MLNFVLGCLFNFQLSIPATVPSSLTIYDQKEALPVEIAVTGADFEIPPKTIQEDLGIGRKPTRLGINLTQPVTDAVIWLTISPIERATTAPVAGHGSRWTMEDGRITSHEQRDLDHGVLHR